MFSNAKINKLFPPKQFNDSDVSKLLLTKERNIVVFIRNENNTKYETFDEIFKLYLTKLPNNEVKKNVSNLFNKGMVYFGASSSSKHDVIFSRILLSPDDKLVGIVLDSNVLDIDVSTGETSAIDDCVYATYFSLVRAGVLNNDDVIRKDKDLHKLLTTYIWHMILRSVGQRTIYNDKQKKLIHIVCIYAYYRHFLKHKHAMTNSIIKRDYSVFFSKEELDEFLPLLEDLSKYDDIKHLPQMLSSMKIYHDKPASLTLNLLSKMGNTGFYAYVSSLDQLIGMVVLSKYPTNLYPKTTTVSDKIHDSVEKIMLKYIDKIQFSPSVALSGTKGKR